ncbi:unnamed protein product [Meganyctiphanes norvegica]|uniref:Uncharacterized protein n=1 Tax=Meganyctiphanes norvegica TaxID=48144 RepID=A0AAV2R9G2_MEGNR
MSEEAAATTPETNNATPGKKRGRQSVVSRATEEGEALLKEMGFEDSDTPGRRRTRAAIKGDVSTPPPPKKERKSTPGGKRGRPKKEKEEKKEVTPAAEDAKEEEKAPEADGEESAADGEKDEEAKE